LPFDKYVNSNQHGMTQTTHHAPPQGKFKPIKSEQQEHMEEVLKKDEILKQKNQQQMKIRN